MQQVSNRIPYANAYREIYLQRLMENDSEALSESVLQAAAIAIKLSEFIDVWSKIGAECGDSTVSEELRNNDPHSSDGRESRGPFVALLKFVICGPGDLDTLGVKMIVFSRKVP